MVLRVSKINLLDTVAAGASLSLCGKLTFFMNQVTTTIILSDGETKPVAQQLNLNVSNIYPVWVVAADAFRWLR